MTKEIEELTPQQLKYFKKFSEVALTEGALSSKEKAIIAVAVATALTCTNCLDGHTKQAKMSGASLQQLLEAVFVVAAVEAGGAVTHSTNMHNAIDDEVDDVLYKKSNLEKLPLLNNHAGSAFKGYIGFSKFAMKEGALSIKMKETIAVAIAHATLCPYCIDVHTRNAIKEGATIEELSEAVLVAAAIMAGNAFNRTEQIITSFHA
ncbi:carboxymuconolactone decarboxylase family protein [Kurthia sibirica]|uniref:Alkylhydroperoxidase n=1 Tax=Kurthia sibirica TaxID=202750 RepID=A0A2U3AN38_9BACL|nr:carboxymuconolactone decarboxylase family protein [Kurthia sibirica]PWI25954.1 alkylhydroperoxidase [Kurthia sibirica]GEK35587.1 hypothetical protein KSI01_31200 [Kurthia sibirica]